MGIVTAGVVALLAAGAADAQRTKIAVLELRAADEQKATAQALAGLVASELARHEDLQVTSAADVQAMIGFEKQRELLGCTDQSCLAEIGGALGVDLLLAGELSRIGSQWLLSLSLVDIQKGKPVFRVSREARSEDALVPETKAAVAELVAGFRARAGKASAPPAPAPAVATAPPPEEGRRVLPWVVLGTGATAAIVGGVLYGTARSDAQAGVLAEDAPAVETRGNAGLGLAIGGLAVAAGSLLLFGGE